MENSALRKNYFLGTKLSFLILSFIILVIAITVHHDIWPFLVEKLPPHPNQKSWFMAVIIFGFLIPLLWLWQDWHVTAVRYNLLSLVIMLMMQILTEITVTHYFFVSMVVPTAILYVGYRIVQLIGLQRVVYKGNYACHRMKAIRTTLTMLSLIFWSIIWFRFTFILFPKLIPVIS